MAAVISGKPESQLRKELGLTAETIAGVRKFVDQGFQIGVARGVQLERKQGEIFQARLATGTEEKTN